MKAVRTAPELSEQVYRAIHDGICDGSLTPGEHLVQEQLAARLGVSRQPVQQAMARLKADGLVEDVGKRGLRVAELDLGLMRHHYNVRAALDGLAARTAAERARGDATVAEKIERQGRVILAAGESAVAKGETRKQIRCDEAFHTFIYDASGNPLVAPTAEAHWRFLRRAMGDVLRYAEPPRAIWREHALMLEKIVSGEAADAEALAIRHLRSAADALDAALRRMQSGRRSAPKKRATPHELTHDD